MDSLYKNINVDLAIDLLPRLDSLAQARLLHVHWDDLDLLLDPTVFEFYNTYSKQMSG